MIFQNQMHKQCIVSNQPCYNICTVLPQLNYSYHQMIKHKSNTGEKNHADLKTKFYRGGVFLCIFFLHISECIMSHLRETHSTESFITIMHS